MKKNSFVEGALIATIGIFLSRAIGLFYVIPFYAMIGVQGGALYSYGYSIYSIFLSLSTTGIPFAISKIVGEQTALGHYHTKERLYKMARLIIIIVSLISFLTLILFAPSIASIILGDIEGGNTVADVAKIIRIIATALLVVPVLATTKGYLHGHSFMAVPAKSRVLEQIVRVFVILAGSYFAIYVFDLGITTAVGISVFGATAGALTAYLYVWSNIKKNKESLKVNEPLIEGEKLLVKNELFQKVMVYAIPFVIIDLVKSLTATIDTFTVVRTLTNLGYSAFVTENAFGVVATWGVKINMIIISLAMGITISLIPNLASSSALKDKKGISRKINQALQILIFTTIPMAVGLSFLAQPVWVAFYDYNEVAIEIFRIMVYSTITFSIFSILVDSLQTLNKTKIALSSLFFMFFFKAMLNIPFMILSDSLLNKGYYGSVFSSIFVQVLAIIFMLISINKLYKVSYTDTLNKLYKTLLAVTTMVFALYLLTIIFPIDAVLRLDAIIQIIVYSFVGALVYLYVSFKTSLIYEVLGDDRVKRYLKKIKIYKI